MDMAAWPNSKSNKNFSDRQQVSYQAEEVKFDLRGIGGQDSNFGISARVQADLDNGALNNMQRCNQLKDF